MKKTHRWMLFFLFLLFLFTISACTKKAEKIVFYQAKGNETTKDSSVWESEDEGNKEMTSLNEQEFQTRTDPKQSQSDEIQSLSVETATTVPETIAVYLCGEVANPGVYLLDAGSRLYQAVELAGGLTDQARAEAVNLARVLTDSEQIYIPNVSEAVSQMENSLGNQPYGSISAGTLESDLDSNKEVSNEVMSDFPVNINQASISELMKLPGIGQVKAEAIVTYREVNGSFSSIEEIKNVPGIKEVAFEKIKGLITVF